MQAKTSSFKCEQYKTISAGSTGMGGCTVKKMDGKIDKVARWWESSVERQSDVPKSINYWCVCNLDRSEKLTPEYNYPLRLINFFATCCFHDINLRIYLPGHRY
jgi:hypothetical protein